MPTLIDALNSKTLGTHNAWENAKAVTITIVRKRDTLAKSFLRDDRK